MKKKLLILCMCGLWAVSAAALVACDSQKEDAKETEAATVETSAEGATETVADETVETPTEALTEPSVETDAEGRELSKTLNGKTPYEAYAEMETLYKTNYEVAQEMTIVIDMNDGNTEMHVEMTEKTEYKYADGNVYAKTESTELFGEATVTEIWYVDGKLYTEEYDEEFNPVKVVMAMTREDAELYYGLGVAGDTLMPMPAIWLEDAAYTKTEDGLYLVSLNITAEMLAESGEDVWGNLSGEGVELHSIVYSFCFNADGSLAYMAYTADMDMMGMACKATAMVVLSGAGTTKVTPPADADAYVEMEFGA